MTLRKNACMTIGGCLWLTLALAGCGGAPAADLPNLAQVDGIVLLDGQPLSGARVLFEPQQSGSTSSAMTDDQGRYEVWYGNGEPGAALGSHTVRIFKMDGDAGPELLPARYNERSELTATVGPGENAVDFRLVSR